MASESQHQVILAAIASGDFHKENAVVSYYGRIEYSDEGWGQRPYSWERSPQEPHNEKNFKMFTFDGIHFSPFDCDQCQSWYKMGQVDVMKKVQDFIEKLISPKPALKPTWDEKVMAPEALVKMYEETALMVSQRSEEDTIKIGLKLVGAIYKWAKNTEFEEQGTDLSTRILAYFRWVLWRETQVTSVTATTSWKLLFSQVISLMKEYMFMLRGCFFKSTCGKYCNRVHERVSSEIQSWGRKLGDMLDLAQARIMHGSVNAVDWVIPPAPQPSLTLACPSFQQHLKAQLPQLYQNIRYNIIMEMRVPDFASLVEVLPYLRDIRTMVSRTVSRKRKHDGEPKEQVAQVQESANVQTSEFVSPLPAETDLSKLQNLDGKRFKKFTDADQIRAHHVIKLAVATSLDSVGVIVPLLQVILLSLCRHALWKDAATIANLLVLSLRESIEALDSTSPYIVLRKSLALALGASAVVLRKSGRASSGAIAAKEADETFEQVHSNGKFGRDLLIRALLKVEHGCCLNNSSDTTAITRAVEVADDAVEVCRQAVSNGNLAAQGRPILARALVMQGCALVKGNRVADAQVSFEEGIALYRGLLGKFSGVYELQLAEALCHHAATYQDQDPTKQYQPLKEAQKLYEGQRLRWSTIPRRSCLDDDVGTFKDEIASIIVELRKAAIDSKDKASRLAFKENDFEGAVKFAKASESLNLMDVKSAKDVRPTQVHHLAEALCISGYSNLMLKRAQAAVSDLRCAVNIYRHAPLLVRDAQRYESRDVKARVWLGVAHCALGDHKNAEKIVSDAIQVIRDRPAAYIRSKKTKENRMVRDAGSSDLSELLVFLAGVQLQGGTQLRQAEASVEEALELMKKHSAEKRPVNADFKKTAWSLRVRIIQADGRFEGVTEALGEAEKVEGRDFGYIFSFTESEEEVPRTLSFLANILQAQTQV